MLDRPCADCGFDPGAQSVAAVPDLLRQNAMAWDELVREGIVRSGRSDPSRWSSLEYLCHLRDAFGHLDRRLALMVSEDDPEFPYWDQDTCAVEDRYDDQEPGTVVAQLTVAAEALANRIGDLPEPALTRTGRRDDGALHGRVDLALCAARGGPSPRGRGTALGLNRPRLRERAGRLLVR